MQSRASVKYRRAETKIVEMKRTGTVARGPRPARVSGATSERLASCSFASWIASPAVTGLCLSTAGTEARVRLLHVVDRANHRPLFAMSARSKPPKVSLGALAGHLTGNSWASWDSSVIRSALRWVAECLSVCYGSTVR